MVTTIDVANYFISKSLDTDGKTPDKLKLQKLVYYAQAWNLTFYNKPLFDEQLEAWQSGPVAPSLYQYCKNYSSGEYPIQSQQTNIFSKSELYVLEEVFRVYGNLNSTQLRKLTHRETPWSGARLGLSKKDSSNEPILNNEIRAYYQNFADLNSEPPKILDIAIEPEKEITVTAKFLDGTTQEVKQSEIVNFILKNKDVLTSEKRKPRRALLSLPS
ncbi:Panacea domain-containing protein [Cyanobacterium aponinum]|uniref:Panacea domain-containing protein n=1 Tax=Cyanobacterium aponinum TaxID=379064 RepID=UPI000C129EC5|nr:type II toxin-antitoxin system antitoxin SocA domain-containing protein [Cyanobacterium aponinum]PHV63800.1 hypothetical protein CSQ80_03030 [Cyanobacterium aponinum IPPAS B-1201]